MSSLEEMMQYADWTSKNSPQGAVAGVADSAIGGYFQGVNQKRKIQSQQLDTMLKIIDIQEKQQKMQIEKRSQEMGENIMKSAGMIPLTEGDHANAMGGAWNGLGGSNPKYVNTSESKLAKMANDMEWRMGWSVKGGVSMKQYPKQNGAGAKQTASEATNEREIKQQVLKMATTSAAADYVKTLPAEEQELIRLKVKQAPPPPQDFVLKYLPAADTYYRKGAGAYSKLLEMGKNADVNDPAKTYSANEERKKTFGKPLPANTPAKTNIWSGTTTDNQSDGEDPEE